MILKLSWDTGKSTIIDGISKVDYNKFNKDELQEVDIQGNPNRKYVYEIVYKTKDDEEKKIYVSAKFFIMNDSGRTIDICKI